MSNSSDVALLHQVNNLINQKADMERLNVNLSGHVTVLRQQLKEANHKLNTCGDSYLVSALEKAMEERDDMTRERDNAHAKADELRQQLNTSIGMHKFAENKANALSKRLNTAIMERDAAMTINRGREANFDEVAAQRNAARADVTNMQIQANRHQEERTTGMAKIKELRQKLADANAQIERLTATKQALERLVDYRDQQLNGMQHLLSKKSNDEHYKLKIDSDGYIVCIKLKD